MYALKFLTLTKSIKNYLKTNGENFKKPYSLTEANLLFEKIRKANEVKKTHNKITIEITCPTDELKYEFNISLKSPLATQVIEEITDHLQENQTTVSDCQKELEKIEIDKFELENKDQDKLAMIKIKSYIKQSQSIEATIEATQSEINILKNHQAKIKAAFKTLPQYADDTDDDEIEATDDTDDDEIEATDEIDDDEVEIADDTDNDANGNDDNELETFTDDRALTTTETTQTLIKHHQQFQKQLLQIQSKQLELNRQIQKNQATEKDKMKKLLEITFLLMTIMLTSMITSIVTVGLL